MPSYTWGGRWPEPTIGVVDEAPPPRHTCPQSAPEFARRSDGIDGEYGIVYRHGAWCLYDSAYYGFDLPIRYCPYCGADLEAQQPEPRPTVVAPLPGDE